MEGGSPRVKGTGTGVQGDRTANLGSWAVHRGVPDCHGFHEAGSGVWPSDRPGGELPAAHSHGVLPLCLDCRAACTGGPLGPGYLYSLPILQTQAWALPAPMPVGISLLTTVSSRGVQGVYPHDWARSQPRRTSASNYPRCRLIPSTSAGRGCRAVLRLCCKMLSLPSSLKNIHLCSMQQRGRLISPGEPPG